MSGCADYTCLRTTVHWTTIALFLTAPIIGAISFERIEGDPFPYVNEFNQFFADALFLTALMSAIAGTSSAFTGYLFLWLGRKGSRVARMLIKAYIVFGLPAYAAGVLVVIVIGYWRLPMSAVGVTACVCGGMGGIAASRVFPEYYDV